MQNTVKMVASLLPFALESQLVNTIPQTASILEFGAEDAAHYLLPAFLVFMCVRGERYMKHT